MAGIHLDSPIAAVLGGGNSKKDKAKRDGLANLGLETVGDLLLHFPRKYFETGRLTQVGALEEGQMLTVVGEVADSKQHTYTDRRTGRPAYRVETSLRTDGPMLKMTFFAATKHLAAYRMRQFSPGAQGLFTGKASWFGKGWQLSNPQFVMFGADPDDEDARTASAREMAETVKGLYPVYKISSKLETTDIARVVAFGLTIVDEIPDPLTPDLREPHGLVDVHTALRWIHTPDDYAQVGAGLKRFRFAEALVNQIVLLRRRSALRAQGAQSRTGGGGLLAAFDERLPFELTEGQREVCAQLEAELAEAHPMNRLLQGEVGSGKTVVALRAMLRVVDSGGQAALLAPTEVLAQQHHRSITAMLGDLAAGGMLGGADESTTVALLTGSMTKAQRRESLLRIASGEAGIVIGTHALLEEHVSFADLGLVVVDEQHRFGVEQRAALTDKAGTPPHVLVMTATPIPRTVAMTVFGDLEVSTLRELPAGRAPIQTNVVPLQNQPTWLARVWERVREEVAKGHQVYVVCPRISGDQKEEGESDQLDVDDEGEVLPVREGALAAVEEVAPSLAEGPLQGLSVQMLHGSMLPEEKEQTMRAFSEGDIDVLVSTTVIEVGVDVANATMMVLLDADRFGISQLHQLRGRVGRGGLPGLCLLVSHAAPDSPAMERLTAVAATTDGFELSEVDLGQRREGDVLGKSQSGYYTSFKHLRVLRDAKTIVAARAAAEQLLAEDPQLHNHPVLAVEVDDLEQSSKSDFMERS
jgi:ATP-dependent DNA helicase RecG